MSMTNVAGIANSNRLRLEFVYDYQGRRMSKTVKSWGGSTFADPTTTLFAYDSWSLLAELNTPGSPARTYLWGQDVSGTPDAAGGIGGLLALLETSNGQIRNADFSAYDGNGNVTALIRATDLSASARYEYSPFGETLRATGPLGKSNPFAFSTKFCDRESGLTHYPVREYAAGLGRWLSRDPITESGGINLTAFTENSPLNSVDGLGTLTLLDTELAEEEGLEAEVMSMRRGSTIVQRVQQASNAHAQGQELLDTILESSESDPSKLVELFTRINNEGFSAGLRGSRAMRAVGEEWHHLMPRQFAQYFKDAEINFDRFQIGLKRMFHQGGQSALHRGGFGCRGGLWNAAWRQYFSSTAYRTLPMAQRQQAILEFSAKMFQFFIGG